MRHDCTLKNVGKYRNIVKHLWTSVIFRLREPIFEKCKSKIQKSIFSWKFQMTQDKPCRGMIGCHILENKSNASVNILINHLLFLHSDDIIRSLEQNGRLLNKSAILF